MEIIEALLEVGFESGSLAVALIVVVIAIALGVACWYFGWSIP